MLEDFEVMAAAKALAQGDFALAWMNARQVLETFPRHPKALLTAGLASRSGDSGFWFPTSRASSSEVGLEAVC